MFDVIRERLEQGFWTSPYPKVAPKLPERFRGLPVLDSTKCPEGCQACSDACPTDAIGMHRDRLQMDLGKCLFCVDCVRACPTGAIAYTRNIAWPRGPAKSW